MHYPGLVINRFQVTEELVCFFVCKMSEDIPASFIHPFSNLPEPFRERHSKVEVLGDLSKIRLESVCVKK
jgi:hypothetical protein